MGALRDVVDLNYRLQDIQLFVRGPVLVERAVFFEIVRDDRYGDEA